MLRILIVEDNRIFLDSYKKVFQEKFPSVAVEEAGNGEDALRKINETPPNFIFMDIRLAGVNGLDLARKIKRSWPHIRIAMLTGYDLPEYRRAASQHGVDRFFVKDSLEWKEIEEFVQYNPKSSR